VGGPTFRTLGVLDGYIYWSDSNNPCWVLRAPLDGSADAQAVAWNPNRGNYCFFWQFAPAGKALLNEYTAQQLGFDLLYVPYSEVSP
jgi:hypothetical protein